MEYKVLSIRAEYAYYVCAGIKKIEYRSRNTNIRGKVMIHASGNGFELLPMLDSPSSATPIFREANETWDNDKGDFIFEGNEQFFKSDGNGGVMTKGDAPDNRLFNWGWKRSMKDVQSVAYPAQAIIGEVEIVDSVKNVVDGWEWILENPVLYRTPLTQIKGKLGFWKFQTPPGFDSSSVSMS